MARFGDRLISKERARKTAVRNYKFPKTYEGKEKGKENSQKGCGSQEKESGEEKEIISTLGLTP